MLHVVSVWLHVLAAAVWIGGAAFLAFVAVPVLRREVKDSAVYYTLLEGVALRFRTVRWIAVAVLFGTGFLQLADHGWGAMFAGRMGTILTAKLAFVVVVVGLGAVHDFAIGPRAIAARGGAGAERARLLASRLGRVEFLLATVIVGLAVMLYRAPF